MNNLDPENLSEIIPMEPEGISLQEGDTDYEKLIVVGLGASAGGFEALQGIIKNLEPHPDISFVITLHMDPNQPSLLAGLLARYSKIPITPIKDGEMIRGNHIYVCPPNYNVVLLNNAFRLTKTEIRAFPRPSINTFFQSLAKEKEEKAVGVVLSGTGSDGADGIQAIKNGGGLTIAQNEKSAKYSSMPHAAISTGLVDAVLSPEEIARQLPEIVFAPSLFQFREHSSSSGIDAILDLLLDRTGTDFSDYKMNTIGRRIERRMIVNKTKNLQEYVELLQNSDKEVKLLHKDLLIIVTQFFRDMEAFDSLKKHLRNLLSTKKDGDTLRIWVPGSATGEEAYSLVMNISEILGKKINRYRPQVFATDISREAIESARRGIYHRDMIQHIPENILDKYFVRKSDYYEISKRLRDMIIFSNHDLIKDPPFLNMDLISCRNLLIYFNSDLQKRIFSIFHHSLKPNGILFLGQSESVSGVNQMFGTLDGKYKIFQKEMVHNPPRLEMLNYYPRHYPGNIIQNKAVEKPVKVDPPNLDEMISSAVLRFFGDSLILLDQYNNVVLTRGRARRFLDFPEGPVSHDIFMLVKNDLRIDLRAAISRVRREKITCNTSRIRILPNGDSELKLVSMTVIPLMNTSETVKDLVLAFHDEPAFETVESKTVDDTRVFELEHELNVMRERLQSTIEELETSNEELQSSNEELQSSNEELQSTNEELETSNEELQSTNEELYTVNEELQVKTRELLILNDEITNTFNIINFGILLLDRDGRVRRYTPFVENLFTIKEQDLGHLIGTIVQKVAIPGLLENLDEAITGQQLVVQDIQNEDKSYHITYHPFYNENKEIDGSIVGIYDITEQKIKDDMIRKQEEIQMAIIKTAPIGITILDESGQIVQANEEAERILRMSEKDITDHQTEWEVHDVYGDDFPQDKLPFSIVKRTKEAVHDVVNCLLIGEERICISINGQPLIDASGRFRGAVFTITDVTEKIECA